MHKPIFIQNISFELEHKICFANFSAQINSGDRIGIIGKNGSGKSVLLQMIAGLLIPLIGKIKTPADLVIGYIHQLIEEKNLSGGGSFNKALSLELSKRPDILILDEPTNHLDLSNKKSLLNFLNNLNETLIVATHDMDLLRKNINIIWHIENGQIDVFRGNYDDYILEKKLKHNVLLKKLKELTSKKKEVHEDLMKEQERAKKSKAKGEKNLKQKKWLPGVAAAKADGAQKNSGNKTSLIFEQKKELLNLIDLLQEPETIIPKFIFQANMILEKKAIIEILDGSIFYDSENIILRNINLLINSQDRIAIMGKNGSGKSTLIKAIINDISVQKTGNWILPKAENIGYLDQHYKFIDPEKTVFENISQVLPSFSDQDIRKHLNSFLFRKTSEVNTLVKNLSGGERARLILAKISARPTKILILDEITNNLDIETISHMVSVLNQYPFAIVLISHDEIFLNQINNLERITIEDGSLFSSSNPH